MSDESVVVDYDDAPRIVNCTPAFKVSSVERAIEHYVTWVGLSLNLTGADESTVIGTPASSGTARKQICS